jgi:hypothetical protein
MARTRHEQLAHAHLIIRPRKSNWDYGAFWCAVVYYKVMARLERSIRQSISLPHRIAKHVHAIARTRRTSTNRVVVDLIEAGIEAKEAEKRRFFALADRIAESDDPIERQRIKEELARMTFGY